MMIMYNVTYFHSFGDDYIPREIKQIIGNKNIATNIPRIQINDSIIWDVFNSIIKGKSFLDYSYLFSFNELEKNDTIMLEYFP